MFNVIKNICFSFVLGMILVWISSILKSSFLSAFLDSNLIMLLIALMAINTTTLSVIMSKLSEITENAGDKFPTTISEMKVSIYEQIGLISVGVFAQILCKSDFLVKSIPWEDVKFLISCIPAAVLVYAITILWDTANAIFCLVSHARKTD